MNFSFQSGESSYMGGACFPSLPMVVGKTHHCSTTKLIRWYNACTPTVGGVIIMPVTIIVHGGAGTLTPERIAPTQEGCKEAALIGWRILTQGGTALDAVEAAVRT